MVTGSKRSESMLRIQTFFWKNQTNVQMGLNPTHRVRMTIRAVRPHPPSTAQSTSWRTRRSSPTAPGSSSGAPPDTSAQRRRTPTSSPSACSRLYASSWRPGTTREGRSAGVLGQNLVLVLCPPEPGLEERWTIELILFYHYYCTLSS